MRPFPLFLCVLIFVFLPSKAQACMGGQDEGLVQTADGESYYQLGDQRFPVDEKLEYLYQRWANVVIAKIDHVSDAEGNIIDDYVPAPHALKKKDPNYEIPKLPLTFHFKVQKKYNGNIEGTFKSISSDNYGQGSSCDTPVRPGEKYLMYLPELPASGAFEHAEIISIFGPPKIRILEKASPVYLSNLQEHISWLEERIDNTHESMSNDEGSFIKSFFDWFQ